MIEAGAPTHSTQASAIIVGLIGSGIGGSGSPYLHQSEADAHGLRLIYRLIDLEQLGLGAADLPRLLDAAELMGFAGLNVTHPCKQAVIPILDSLSDGARRVGAVNTVVFAAGRRIGHNTDEAGFSEGFRRKLPDAPVENVAQLGAGGAGSATASALLGLGCRTLRLVDSDATRAVVLADRLRTMSDANIEVVSSPDAALQGADGLVNATPVGMTGHPGTPLDPALLRPDLWVADIVYFPLRTALLDAAEARGCATVDGSGMAVFQAALAFEHFTGRPADRERMLAAFAASRLQQSA